jgi:hypothetical protein
LTSNVRGGKEKEKEEEIWQKRHKSNGKRNEGGEMKKKEE